MMDVSTFSSFVRIYPFVFSYLALDNFGCADPRQIGSVDCSSVFRIRVLSTEIPVGLEYRFGHILPVLRKSFG